MIGKRIFDLIWGVIDKEDAPEPKYREIALGKTTPPRHGEIADWVKSTANKLTIIAYGRLRHRSFAAGLGGLEGDFKLLLGLGLADHFALERGYWIGITAVVILQPFLATTWQRTVERVVGSVLGGLIAAAIGLILPDPMEIVALLFPLAVATMAVRGVNYTLFVLLLTPQFVLIAELFQTGLVPSWHLAGLRAIDSVLGGALGLAAGFLLWPSREATQLPKQLAQALRANRDYLAAALAGVPDAELQAARRRKQPNRP